MSIPPSTPYYIVHEDKLRENLKLISKVARKSDVEIILAFKAFALWKTFGIFREYIKSTTASSPFEAKLAKEEFESLAHTYSPAYEDGTFNTILECSEYVTFNSFTQYAHFYDRVKKWNEKPANHKVSVGIRINPERSDIQSVCAGNALWDFVGQNAPNPTCWHRRLPLPLPLRKRLLRT